MRSKSEEGEYMDVFNRRATQTALRDRRTNAGVMLARALGATWVACLLFVGVTGCESDPCPPGQVEQNGECVDVTGDASAICGAGTYLVDGACRPDPEQVCGQGTEVQWVLDENGQPTYDFICLGTGDIVEPPECPAATPGGPICVNGFIKWLLDPDDPSQALSSLAQFESPTVSVKVYDPLLYASNPNVAPLGVGEVIHADGTFRVEDIEVPSTGFVALVVDDADETGADDFVFTGFAYSATAGQNLENADAYATSAAQNTAWSDAIGSTALEGAGCGAGDTLFDCGTWVGVFGYHEDDELAFIEGAQPQKFPGPSVLPAESIFYLDEDYESFLPGPGSTTSTGMVFYPSATLGNYTGECAADTPCDSAGYTWNQSTGTTGGAAPSAIFVQLMEPEGLD
jgi:hypothetical protein